MADIFDFYVYDDRSIQFTLAEPIMLEDKDVTEFRFRIPKSLNGFDMSTWAWWFVYVNAKREKFSIPLTLVDDEDEPESFSTATFSINYGITEKDGGIQFALEVIDADNGGNVLHEWHTRTYYTAVIWTLQGNQVEYEEDITQDILSSIFEQLAQNRAQIALLKNYVTPEMFGAKGDGSTDDSTAIQNAINSLSQNQVLYFSSGKTYKVGSNLIVDTSYIKLLGGGMYQSTLSFDEGVTLTINKPYVSVDGLHFYSGGGVVNNKYHVQFLNCWFSYSNVGLTNNSGYITQCLNCYFTNNTLGILLNNESFETIFDSCVIDNNQIGVIVTGSSCGAIFSNCTIEGNYNRTSGNGCGLVVGCTNLGLNIDKCWFESNGTSDSSADFMMYHGSYIPSSLSSLVSEINAIYDMSSKPSGKGIINILNSVFNYTKNGICLFNNDSCQVNAEGNRFSGILDKYNRAVYVNSPNTIPFPINASGNTVVNTANATITTQMLKGIKASYIYLETLPATTDAVYKKLCEGHVLLDGKPLFVYEGNLSDLTGTKTPLYMYQSGGTSVNAGRLYGSHVTNTYKSTGTTYLSTVKESSSGVNLHNSVGTEISIILIRPVGSTVKIQNQATGWQDIKELLTGMNKIYTYVPSTRTIFASLPCVVFEMIVLSAADIEKMNGCLAFKGMDVDYSLFDY